MAQTPATSEIKDLVREADELKNLVLVMSEAGLCSKSNAGCLDEVLTKLGEARTAIAAGTAPQARAALLSARVQFDAVVKSRSWWWRFVFVHRGFLFLYLVACLVVLLNVASGYLNGVAREFWGVPASALGMGAAGAILRALYWLHRQVARRIFRAQFALAHVAAPVIGLLFGLFTFLLVKGGLLVLQEGQTGDLEGTAGILGLCFVAGFSWEWILNWVKKFVEGTGNQHKGGAGGGDGGGNGDQGDKQGGGNGSKTDGNDGKSDGAGAGEGDAGDGGGVEGATSGAAGTVTPSPPQVNGVGPSQGSPKARE